MSETIFLNKSIQWIIKKLSQYCTCRHLLEN